MRRPLLTAEGCHAETAARDWCHENSSRNPRGGCLSITSIKIELIPWKFAGRSSARVCKCGRVSFVLKDFSHGTVAGGLFVLFKSLHIRWDGVCVSGGADEQSGHVAPGGQAEWWRRRPTSNGPHPTLAGTAEAPELGWHLRYTRRGEHSRNQMCFSCPDVEWS